MKRKRWYLSPPFIVTTTALLTLAGMFLLGWINARRYRLTAQVEIGTPVIAQTERQKQVSESASQWSEGEVARTAERVREATALLMGLALLAVNEAMHHRHHTQATTLLSLMGERNLFPPKLQRISPEELTGLNTRIAVRFRAAPFGLEVVSFGNAAADGSPLIARLTAGGTESANVVLLMAKKYDAVIPAPFAPLTEVQAIGWRLESLHERSLSSEESQQLNLWAQQYLATGK